jgi:heptose-I-phosphate ethanolaminephosphotransferase
LIDKYKKYLFKKVAQIRILNSLKFVVVLIVICSIYFSLPFRISFFKILNAESIFEIDNYVSYQALNTPFHNLLFGLKLRDLERKELGNLAKVQQNIQIDSCTFNSPEIVFIIGESYIKSHSQLYGYQMETTPLQKQRTTDTGNGLLIPFTDVITTSNYTSTVFKNIFSLKSIDDQKDWGKSSLFPVLFRKAKYHVSFITSQFVQDSRRDIFDLTGGLFLNNNEISSLSFDCRNNKDLRYDETLLEYYDSLKVYNKEYNLTIFHMIGQHIDFYKRSPKEWKKFQLKDYQDRQDINEQEKIYVADYDNATLYNDYVVDQIIKRFENKDAVVIYMPDHGEGCYDGGHRLGRMPKGEYSKSILQNEYDIPFWIWCSKMYQENHPHFFQQIKDAQNRPFMTDDIPHLLLYLGGIKCHEYQEKKNLISPYYDVHRKRLLNGEVDYDSIIRNK